MWLYITGWVKFRCKVRFAILIILFRRWILWVNPLGGLRPFFLSKSCVYSCEDVSSLCAALWLWPALFPLLLSGRQFPVVGFRQLQTPTCRGSTHCTSVATASPRTVCLAVGSSRNVRKVACVAVEDLAYSWSIYKKTSWGAECRVECRLA